MMYLPDLSAHVFLSTSPGMIYLARLAQSTDGSSATSVLTMFVQQTGGSPATSSGLFSFQSPDRTMESPSGEHEALQVE